MKEPNKKVTFELEQMYSPQAKKPNSLSKTKSKKKKKDKLNSTKTFLRKRLGENRFNEIMKAISENPNASYEVMNDILTPAEKDLSIFISTVLLNDTPKTDSSFRENTKGTSKFGEQSRTYDNNSNTNSN